MEDDRLVLIMLILTPLLLWTVGDWLSCYFMISGGSSWCEPVVGYFEL